MAREHRHAETMPPHGVKDVSPVAAQPGTQAAWTSSPSGFWRVRIYLPTAAEVGAPDHVVAARDAIEAEAHCYTELGIRSVDKSVNTVEISPATEAEYIAAQVRRQPAKDGGNDLLNYRKTKDADGKDLDEKHPDYGRLTWTPPPGVTIKGSYKVTDQREVIEG